MRLLVAFPPALVKFWNLLWSLWLVFLVDERRLSAARATLAVKRSRPGARCTWFRGVHRARIAGAGQRVSGVQGAYGARLANDTNPLTSSPTWQLQASPSNFCQGTLSAITLLPVTKRRKLSTANNALVSNLFSHHRPPQT